MAAAASVNPAIGKRWLGRGTSVMGHEFGVA
jgi:hypothetical protein